MFAPPSSQIATLSAMLGRFAARYQPYRTAPAAEFSISGGIHDGCRSVFAQDRVRLGTNAENDLVLVDSEIGDEHAELELVHSLLGPLAAVRALKQPLKLDGATIAPGQQTQFTRLPIRLEFEGDLFINISARKRVSDRKLSRTEIFLKRARFASLGLLLGAFGLLLVEASYGRNFLVLPPQETLQAATFESTPRITLQDFVDRLDQAGIGRKLRVVENADGVLTVSGQLTPEELRSWQDIAKWYDSTSFGRPLVTSLSFGTKFQNLPPISMLRLDEPKRIFLADGGTLGLNDVLTDDWIVSKIEHDHIEVRRENQREVIRFAEGLN